MIDQFDHIVTRCGERTDHSLIIKLFNLAQTPTESLFLVILLALVNFVMTHIMKKNSVDKSGQQA